MMMENPYRDSRRSRNGNEIFALSENPGKRNLTRGAVVLLSNGFKTIDKFQDIGKV